MRKLLLILLAVLPACRIHSPYTDRLIVDSGSLLKIRHWRGGRTDTLASTAMPIPDSVRQLAAWSRRDSVIESYFIRHGVDSMSSKEGPWWVYLQKIDRGDEFFIVRRNTDDTLQIGPYTATGWAKIVTDSAAWQGKSLVVGTRPFAWTWHP